MNDHVILKPEQLKENCYMLLNGIIDKDKDFVMDYIWTLCHTVQNDNRRLDVIIDDVLNILNSTIIKKDML